MKYTSVVLFICLSVFAQAQQRYFAEKANVVFFSDGVIEDIRAVNTKVTSIFDVTKGDIAFLLSIKDFQFEKNLMQVHFNEKYMESEKFPKSSFQGKITGFSMQQSGVQQVRAVGKLTIHGVTKEVELKGTAERSGGQIFVKSKFIVKLEDYGIKVPQIVWQNIAQQVEVTVDFTYRSF
ncbi:MAG TPA: YceI family protein [Ohtaekwangia sp.]